MRFLDNSSIPAKLTIGFGILIFSIIFVAIVGIYSLNIAAEGYSEYRSLARQANADGRVQANMLTTRVFAKDFVIDPTDDSVTGVNERAEATLNLISEAISLSSNPVFEVMLNSIYEDLNEYIAYFEQITELQDSRNELVLNSLNQIGPVTERNLTDIMQSALIDGDTEASNLAGLSLRSLLLGRLYANRFLVENSENNYERAIIEFFNMDSELSQLSQILENPERITLLESTISNKDVYLSTLREVHDIILARNDIIENRLDRIGPRVADEIEDLKLAIQSEQDALGPLAQANLDRAQTTTISITLVAIILGIGAATLIGRAILHPLKKLTLAADAIAGGDHEVEIQTGRYDEIGRLAKAFVTMREAISEKVNSLELEVLTREAAEKDAAQRRQVFMDSSDPIIIENLEGVIVDVNQEAIRAYHYLREELIGESIRKLIPTQHHTEANELFKLVSSGEKIRNVEGLRWNKRQEIIPVSLTFSQLKDDQGAIVAIATIAKDISLQKEAENALQKERDDLESKVQERTEEVEAARKNAEELRDLAESASQSKANFLATMSHEIRTPMNGIIGMVDLLRQSSLDDECRPMVQTISDSGNSLLTIINDILDFSKIEAGKLELEEIDFSIMETVESSIEAIKGNALNKGLDLITYIDPRIPQHVRGDSVRVRQIVTNLSGNAIKFTEKGRVVVRADLIDETSDTHSIQFQVIDNGIGISEEAQSTLFHAFTQAESSTTREHGGTGLGLSISHRLVEIMEGEIGVDSELGKGSKFHFQIDFPRSDQKIVAEQISDFSGLRMMVVAEDPMKHFIAQKYLEHWSAEVTVLENISHLIEKAKRMYQLGTPLDIVIICSDWTSIESIAAREKFRLVPELEHVKFVLLTKGRRRRPRLDNLETVQIDVSPMQRVKFLTAVSIAAGRASPEVYHEEKVINLKSQRAALSAKDAANQNALILVAEDNPTNRDVISRQLTLLGYTAEFANDGAEALKAWETGIYSLLLSDCHMPVMDGYELTKSIRVIEKSTAMNRTPIIAITANALQGEAEKCYSVGMDDYLTKPLEMLSLRKKLRDWMPHFDPNVADYPQAVTPEDSTEKLLSEGSAVKHNAAINPDFLKGIFGDDPELILEILSSFLEPSGEIVEELKSAVLEKSADGVKQAAHKLKSASRSIGANQLADLCEILEEAGQEGQLSTIENNIQYVEPLMDGIKSYIHNMS